MTTSVDVIIKPGAEWRYWDAVMQTWKPLNSPPTEHQDILVQGLDRDGEPTTIYFHTDRDGTWLGGTSGRD